MWYFHRTPTRSSVISLGCLRTMHGRVDRVSEDAQLEFRKWCRTPVGALFAFVSRGQWRPGAAGAGGVRREQGLPRGATTRISSGLLCGGAAIAAGRKSVDARVGALVRDASEGRSRVYTARGEDLVAPTRKLAEMQLCSSKVSRPNNRRKRDRSRSWPRREQRPAREERGARGV